MLVLAILNSYLEPANGPRRPILRERFAAMENTARGRTVAPTSGELSSAESGR